MWLTQVSIQDFLLAPEFCAVNNMKKNIGGNEIVMHLLNRWSDWILLNIEQFEVFLFTTPHPSPSPFPDTKQNTDQSLLGGGKG